MNNRIYQARMQFLADAIKELGPGHEGPASWHYTIGCILEWQWRKYKDVKNSVWGDTGLPGLTERAIEASDPGFVAARAIVILNSTRFYICTDCRAPMSYDEAHPEPDEHLGPLKGEDSCPFCGDGIGCNLVTITTKGYSIDYRGGEDDTREKDLRVSETLAYLYHDAASRLRRYLPGTLAGAKNFALGYLINSDLFRWLEKAELKRIAGEAAHKLLEIRQANLE